MMLFLLAAAALLLPLFHAWSRQLEPRDRIHRQFNPEDIEEVRGRFELTERLFREYGAAGLVEDSKATLRRLYQKRVPVVGGFFDEASTQGHSTFLEFADGTILRLDRAEAILIDDGRCPLDGPEELLSCAAGRSLVWLEAARDLVSVVLGGHDASVRIVARTAVVVA